MVLGERPSVSCQARKASIASPMVATFAGTGVSPRARSASMRWARSSASRLFRVLSDDRCCLPLAWQLASQTLPRRNLGTRSPTGIDSLAFVKSDMDRKSSFKDNGQQAITPNAKVLAGTAGTRREQSAGAPVVDRALRHLQEISRLL